MKLQSITWFFIAWLAVGHSLSAGLPPVERLLCETEEACRKLQEDTGESPDWNLITLAKAKAYADDYAGAIQITRSLPGLLSRVALGLCFEIEREQTGAARETVNEIVALSKTAEDPLDRLEFAQMLVDSGKLAEAQQLLPRQEEDRKDIFVLTEFYLHLAAYQARMGDPPGAAASLQRADGLSARWKQGSLRRRVDWLEATQKVWLTVENKKQALATAQAAHELVQASGTAAGSGESARVWSNVAKLHMLVGESEPAREALRTAARTAESAGPTPDTQREYRDLALQNQAKSFNEIGGRQFTFGFNEDAAKTYLLGMKAAGQIQDPLRRQGTLLERLTLQSDAGDSAGALETLELLQAGYWQAAGCCRCARALATQGKRPEAQQLLRRAESLANDESGLNNKAHIALHIAEVHAAMGDLAQARSAIKKACELGDAGEDGNFRQPIALAQIRCGMLDDAYETTMAIEELPYRVVPLAMLAERAAKANARNRKPATSN